MTRRRFWLIGIPAALVAAGAIAALTIDPRAIVEAQIADATGRDVTLEKLELDLGSVTEVRLTGLTVAGESADAPPMAKLDTVDVAVEVWPLLSDRLRIPKLAVSGGTLHLTPAAMAGGGEGGGMRLEHVDSVSIDNIAMTLVVQGQASEANVAHLGATYDAASGRTALDGKGTLGGAAFTLTGTTAQFGQLGEDQAGEIPIDVNLTLAEATATVKGALRPGPALDAKVEAKAPELADLLRLLGIDVKQVGPVTATATLAGNADALAARDVVVALGGKGGIVESTVTGEVADILTPRGVALNFRTTVPDLPALAPLIGQDPGLSGRLTATGKIADAEGSLTVPQLEMHLRDDDRHSLVITGRIGALPFADAALTVKGELRSLPNLPAPLPEVMKQLAPLAVAGNISGGMDKLRLSDLTVEGADTAPMRLTVTGQVGQLALVPEPVAQELDLKLDGRIAHLPATAPLLAALQPGAPSPVLPDPGEIMVTGAITGSSTAPALRNLRAEVVSGTAAGTVLAGDIGNLLAIGDTRLGLKLRGTSLAAFDPELPADSGEVVGDIAITAGKNGDIGLDQVEMTVGDMTFTGQATLGADGGLAGDFHTAHLRLDRLVGGGGGAAAGDDRVFPDTPLPMAALRKLNGDVTFVADKVSVGDHVGEKLTMRLAAEDGKVRLELSPFAYAGGEMAGTVEIDAAAAPARALTGKGQGMELAVLSTLSRQPAAITGKADAEIRLSGVGDSPHAIASSLNGEAAVVAANGTIQHGLVNLIAADLLTEVVGRAVGSDASTPLQCMLADFQVKSGVANAKALFLSTDKIVITGKGNVKLGPERYDLSLLPAPKDPSLLSLAQRVNVTGPLTDPTFTPDTGSLAWSAVQALVGNALLPGAGLLLPMLSTGSGDEHPCASEVKAMPKEKGVVDKATGAVGKATGAVGGAVKGAGKAVGDVVKGIGDLFK
jgi:hypothetical protein